VDKKKLFFLGDNWRGNNEHKNRYESFIVVVAFFMCMCLCICLHIFIILTHFCRYEQATTGPTDRGLLIGAGAAAGEAGANG
jgi:hypothetical protein